MCLKIRYCSFLGKFLETKQALYTKTASKIQGGLFLPHHSLHLFPEGKLNTNSRAKTLKLDIPFPKHIKVQYRTMLIN
jgi:hypothetical protein